MDHGVALMAEIKRASPSKGDIQLDAVAPVQARTYALAGASVVSVLTEPTWFKGGLLDMRLARAAVDSLPDRPAILRKDFVFDMYQILEARVHGADTVLLIVAMLSPSDLAELYQFAQGLGMEPLVEVNNASVPSSFRRKFSQATFLCNAVATHDARANFPLFKSSSPPF